MATTKFLWILSLNVLFLIGKVTEIDGISTVAPVTGVEAELNALNTTALQLIWNSNSQSKPDNVSIEQFEIKLEDVSRGNVTFDNETDFYNYTITDLDSGANYTVVLIVHYAEEIPDTTTATPVETTVTSPDTTSTAALTTTVSASTTINATSNMELMHPGDPELRLWSPGQESIYLFNNTYPATPIDVTLTDRDTQSLTFNWTQDGEANGCSMWIEDDTTTTSPTTTPGNCQFTEGGGGASGTISGLPVAGRLYTVHIVSISGGLSSDESQILDRTLPPNPSAAQCISQTNASLNFQIPPPYDQPPSQYKLDGYEVIMESLDQPFTYYTNTSVVANESTVILIPVDELVAGVTYKITLTTMVADVRSADSNSSICVTELNVPVINNVINTTKQTIQVAWQTPLGYFEGFNLSCIGKYSAKNVYDIHEQISNNTEYQLIDECHNATAGALYEVNVASVLLDPMFSSNASESLSTVTVPFAPKDVTPSNATTDFIEISVNYDYSAEESQCTHFEVKNLTGATQTVPKISSFTTVGFQELAADSSFNFSTTAVSNYSETDSNFWRSSYNSVPTTAWTLAPSVSNIQQLKQEPRSLLVQFDQPETHEHVWQYVIHVDTAGGRFNTINLICSDVHEEALTELNCDTSSAETAEMHNVTCRTTTPCELATVIPESTTRIPDSTASGSRREPIFSDEEPPLDRVSNGTAQSICHNISGLDPYINYTISIQAVNPGGCSQKATADFMTLGSTPGCVNITSVNAGNVSIEVHWEKPDQPNGIITQYVITWRWQGCCIFPWGEITNETFYTIKAVPPYSNYTIRVAAATELGVGDVFGCPSATAWAKTGIGSPYQPILSVSAISSTALKISWTLSTEAMTGPDTYYNLTITDSENGTWIIKEHVEGFDNRSIVVEGLDEYWLYNVTIVAYTKDKNSVELTTDGDMVPGRTAESIPGPVQFFNATSLSYINQCYETRIVWDPPTDRDLNGKITGYELRWSKVDGSDFNNKSFPPGEPHADVRVEPNGQVYNFTIMAFTRVGLGTPVNSSVVSTGFCKPAPLDVNAILSDPSENSLTTFNVTYDPNLFRYNDNGPVIASALLVAEDSETLNETEQYGGSELFNGTKTWSQAVKSKPPLIPEYRPTPDNWLNSGSGFLSSSSVRRRREFSATYIVGNNQTCSVGYCNGPLVSNRKYRVRAVVCTQVDQCFQTNLSVLFITQVEPQADDLAWIAGVVIGVLALIALIAFLIYFFLFRNRRYGSESSNKEIHLPDFPNVNPEEIARPVRIADFPAHVAEMHRNSDLEFNDEYQSIQTHSARRPWTAAERPKNRVKNRFVNILPFDHSRVVLRMRDDDDDTESDYINANYIPTMGGGIREFIACQGPLESTIDDFWQMVWEHNSRVIVMLTNVKEKGREKCAQYWPGRLNEPSRYRTIDVSLMSESHLDYYVVRNLKVSMGAHTRDVVQFHFVSWPDFGVPAEPEKVLAFVREVRQCAGHNLDPPMIVHCSAGVGRTGTFIVIDRLLREIPRAETIDIFSMVLHLRENRCLMVQTEAQYVFIHDCMKLEIERMLYGNQGYDDQYDEYISEEPIYQNSDQNQIDSNNIGHQTFKSD